MESWVSGFLGGALIGLAASVMLLFIGRILGVSGILNGAMRITGIDRNWQWSFILGVLIAGIYLVQVHPHVFTVPQISLGQFLLGGFLVGFGTVLGSGCTSGHGVCGLSRFSARSLLATLTFLLFGILTVAVRNWGGF